ncbi:MAG: GldL-related protein [Bacteroidia bacterium]
MYTISEQQIEYILNDIRRNGVEMEDLQLNLLDHICCIIEQNLKDGDDFEGFYKKTIKEFYKNNLWEIEEETITLLTFKHYYAMKRSMIISGTTAVVFLLAGAFFKIMHWPGANPALLLGLVLISFIFLPLLFILKTRDGASSRDKIVTGLAVVVGFLLCMSTLFKLFHWPGAGVLWILTSAFSIFVFIPVYFFTGIRVAETKVNTIVTTIILVGATGMLFSLTSLKSSKTFEFFTFASTKDLIATRNFATEQNKARYEWLLSDTIATANKSLAELKQRTNDLYLSVEKIKLEIVNAMTDGNATEIDYTKLFETPFANAQIPQNLLFSVGQPGPLLTGLKKEVIAFNTFIKNNYNKSSFGMIDTKGTVPVNNDGPEIPWEVFNFNNEVPFQIVIRNLTQIQLDIRIVERSCML